MTSEVNYPEHYKRLSGLLWKLAEEIPGTMSGFGQLHKNAVREGALNTLTKELIALGIAMSVRCDGR